MAKNIEKIAAGLGATVVVKVPNTGGGTSVPHVLATSSQPYKPVLCLGKGGGQVGPPMPVGCAIPRCR